MKFIKILLTFLFLACLNFAIASDEIKSSDETKVKKTKFFKKKQQTPKAKMVETVQEWEVESQNVPLEERELKKPQKEVDKKYFEPNLRYVFKRYNYPQGTRELNFEDVKKNLFYYSYLVADNECRYAAYVHYYFSPDTNQISSNLFVEKLDTKKTKTKRILEYRHKQLERIPVAQSGIDEYYPNLFGGLSVVDWSKDSKKVLIKERIGSTQGGVYKTYMHVHFLEDDINNRYTIKLSDFDSAVKNYFINWENKQIVKYRYDIEPLGFSENNDNVVVALLYVINNEGKKILLGTWGYDIIERQTMILSKDKNVARVSSNSLILQQILD